MPELPDVAGFKRYLDATSLHQTIDATHCHDDRFIKGVSRQSLQRRLKGAELKGSARWGKWLLAELSGEGYLVLHFGMTGQLQYGSEDETPEHTRFELHFANGRRLWVISVRMIGRASWTSDVQTLAHEQDLGPDALSDDLDKPAFLSLLGDRRGSVKSALMNQSILAGIGNVYSDEILFQAGIHPASRLKKLSEPDLRNLHTVMRRVLRVASRKGGDARKAPRSWLLGNRDPDNTCPRCGQPLQSTTVNGRTSWFCPNRQAKPA